MIWICQAASAGPAKGIARGITRTMAVFAAAAVVAAWAPAPARAAPGEAAGLDPPGSPLRPTSDPALPGDADHSGSVDHFDLAILAHYYRMTTGATWSNGDFTADGAVDVMDLAILSNNYGRVAWGETTPVLGAAAVVAAWAPAPARAAPGEAAGLDPPGSPVGPTSDPAHPGDANRDTYVDVFDLAIVAHYYRMTSGATWSQGDFTADGAVDVMDLAILSNNYGWSPDGGTTPVPEPSSALLLLAGAAAALARRRRRRPRRR